MKLIPILLLAACGSDFDPYNRINSLRILAVRAEPPFVASGEGATLEALVFSPDAGPIAYAWSWCPLRGNQDNAHACLVTEEELSAQISAGQVPISYDLGTEPAAELDYLAPPEALAAICDGTGAGGYVPTSCELGFPVSVGLTVTQGEAEVRAFKEVILRLGPDDADNTNPRLEGLEVETGAAGAPLAVAPPLTRLRRGAEIDLVARVPASAAETFVRDGADERERLALTWFVQAGDTDSERTTFIDGEVGFDMLERNVWQLPERAEYDGEQAAVIVVLRDNRGGVDWLERAVELE